MIVPAFSRQTLLLPVVIFLIGCDRGQTPDPEEPATSPNILLIIADDLGKDALAGFSEGSAKPHTPYLDSIRLAGLTFGNFWVTPTCSPTRASIITGKYGYRTGVKWANDSLSDTEQILHEYLSSQTNQGYATALIGKWHLSGESQAGAPGGMDYFAGLTRGAVQDYYRWQLTDMNGSRLNEEYTTKVFTDLSIDWIQEQTKPWFLWLAYNAPHTPFHVPPGEMHSQGSLPEYSTGLDPEPYYFAAIEAMDYQIGRLLASIPETDRANTILLFLGDNGTPNQVAQVPYSSTTVKGTLYQGGINVPLIVSGKQVTRSGEDQHLLCSTDLFSTIAELAGVNVPQIHDSYSFLPLLSADTSVRQVQYSEMDDGTDNLWAISDGTHKLIVSENGEEACYHLSSDPYETTNLLNSSLSTEAETAKNNLHTHLEAIRN